MGKDASSMIRLMIENATLRSQLRDQNYLMLAAKLAFLPDNSDFSDDSFAGEILKRLNPKK